MSGPELAVDRPPAPVPAAAVYCDPQSLWHEAWWGGECLGLFATEADGWAAVRARKDG